MSLRSYSRKEHAGGSPDIGFEDGKPVGLYRPEAEDSEDLLDHVGKESIGSADEIDVERSLLARSERRDYEQTDYRMLARYLIEWIHQEGKANREGVLIRAYVVCMAFCPDLYENASQTAMADHIGISRASLNRWVVKFRDEFGFAFANMKNEGARAKYRKIDRRKEAAGKSERRNFRKFFGGEVELMDGGGI